MFAIASSHTNWQSIGGVLCSWYDSKKDTDAAVMQRQIWVPFHFLPGGEGDTLEEKMICNKDSAVAREMMEHHIEIAADSQNAYGLHMLGVAAHVYMDTFAHYGFIGESSSLNAIDGNTLKTTLCVDPEMNKFLERHRIEFSAKYAVIKALSLLPSMGAKSEAVEAACNNLGHGGVSTYPDRPFLKWRFDFEKKRLGNGKTSMRDNQETYFDGCKKLYEYFSEFRSKRYADSCEGKNFSKIENVIKDILSFEGEKDERSKRWVDEINKSDTTLFAADDFDKNVKYEDSKWQDQSEGFADKESSSMIESDLYRFHQAAALHRWYVLKDLLPKHGIAVL